MIVEGHKADSFGLLCCLRFCCFVLFFCVACFVFCVCVWSFCFVCSVFVGVFRLGCSLCLVFVRAFVVVLFVRLCSTKIADCRACFCQLFVGGVLFPFPCKFVRIRNAPCVCRFVLNKLTAGDKQRKENNKMARKYDQNIKLLLIGDSGA